MKVAFLLILLLLPSFFSVAQNRQIDSLYSAIRNEKTDTGKIVLTYQLGLAYRDTKPDSALFYAQQAYFASKEKKFIKGESWSLNVMASAFNSIGNFPKALEFYIEQLKIEEIRGYSDNIASVYLDIALVYDNTKNYDKAIVYAKQADSIITSNHFEELSLYSLLNIGEIYEKKNELDSALAYTKRCYAKSIKAGNDLITGTALNNLGNIYLKSKNFEEAFINFTKALPLVRSTGDNTTYAESLLGLAKIFEHRNQADSAIYYGKESFAISSENRFLIRALDASIFLSQLYKHNNKPDSAFAYQETMIILKDSIESREKINQFQDITFGEQLRLRELEEAKLQIRNQIKTYALLAGIVAFMVLAFLQFRINRIRKKTNLMLENQKNELQYTLQELKTTQAQLIQSEKMASLGELTAGIAHEIQNPLNFVNNFSEVNAELITEMKNEIESGNLEEVKAIANDIAENGQKINHHGKRADAIVKGMLQHSRRSTGQKELTDINALADEYLRLSYHGIRAKDKLFTATMKTDFDEHAGKINIVPQDIGRVLLNLYNNAFYAVSEKKNSLAKGSLDFESFEPTVTVATKLIKAASGIGSNKISISVKDNGNGIPQHVLDKIFQPFFTTKPTGKGTGLGLSLSYDIIKSHNGELKANTKDGEGAEFIIILPA
ncbi:MAG TPA: tetratricopeptide repeat protein [Puia sp.]|nr:tetratricopeptide repeat protein [Puia sp.]